jgi:hypothetical protein
LLIPYNREKKMDRVILALVDTSQRHNANTLRSGEDDLLFVFVSMTSVSFPSPTCS